MSKARDGSESRENLSAVSALHAIVGFHVSLANSAIRQHFQLNYGALGLTQKQIAVLWLIDAQRDTSQSNMARALKVGRATIKQMIDTLRRRGYLEHGQPGRDRRHQLLALTSKGLAELERCKMAINEHEQWVVSQLTKSEVQTLMKLLGKIHEGALSDEMHHSVRRTG